MGVPKFYRWISERYPCLSEVVKENQIPEFDNLYLDMNGIIHPCSHPNDEDVHFRITEEQIFKAIFHYIEVLFRIIKPRKVFFMAVDGVAPRAKMNQQRGRRFRSAKEAEEREKEALAKGEILPSEKRFDSNCITPGTPFMVRLQEQLKYFVRQKLTQDPMWKGLRVYLSGHETPGEGEHKIMDFIRAEKADQNYDPNTRHCLYGLDADLIMLGLISHEPHFSLLREEVRFGKIANQKRPTTPEETTFHLLHLSLMREYLEIEFSPVKSKIDWFDGERIIDDWVLMGFLVGNDFIPHLPDMHISHNALPLLYKSYMEVLPSLGGYLHTHGKLNLHRFEKFLAHLSQFDRDNFEENNASLGLFAGKTDIRAWESERVKGKKQLEKERRAAKALTNQFTVLDNLDELMGTPGMKPELEANNAAFQMSQDSYDEEFDDTFDAEFKAHKMAYYSDKFEVENITDNQLAEIVYNYILAIQWILDYYYNGIQSWGWYYPYHYAPYMSDLQGFSNATLKYEKGKPFLPFQQLLGVLPAASKELLPLPYQKLMTMENSPIIDYYPVDFASDLNGKLQQWEAVVLIPFIDEKRLLAAMAEVSKYLSDEEKSRNRHGPHLLHTCEETLNYTYPSSLPGHFPDINACKARCVEIAKDAFHLHPSKLYHGLCKGVMFGVYFPGFPTLHHLNFTSTLKKDDIKIFQQNSRGDSVILTVQTENPDVKSEDVAKELLGKTCFAEWPHLREVRVVAVADDVLRYELEDSKLQGSDSADKPSGFKSREMSDFDAGVWVRDIKAIQERYHKRKGVKIGPTYVVVYACPLMGRRYISGVNGIITLEKQWALRPVPFAYQMLVKDIAVHDSTFQQFKTLEEVYPTNSQCFMLGSPNYGCQGNVMEIENGRVRVLFTVPVEPNLSHVKNSQERHEVQYLPAYVIGQRLGLTSLIISRLSGTIFVGRGSRSSSSVGPSKNFNIGLNLKFNKTSQEIQGYSKKDESGTWLYSTKVIDVIKDYMTKFPEVFAYLSQHPRDDSFFEDDLFKGKSGRMKELQDFVSDLPCAKVSKVSIGQKNLDEPIVKLIEEEVQKSLRQKVRKQKMAVRPHLLYRPLHYLGNLIPDPEAEHELFDRVINVREGFSVPLGLHGVIIGIQPGSSILDHLYEVVFDEEFPGGLKIRCTGHRGYKVPTTAIINISYGMRKEQSQQQSNKPMAVVKPQVFPQPNAQTQSRGWYSNMVTKLGSTQEQQAQRQPQQQQQPQVSKSTKQPKAQTPSKGAINYRAALGQDNSFKQPGDQKSNKQATAAPMAILTRSGPRQISRSPIKEPHGRVYGMQPKHQGKDQMEKEKTAVENKVTLKTAQGQTQRKNSDAKSTPKVELNTDAGSGRHISKETSKIQESTSINEVDEFADMWRNLQKGATSSGTSSPFTEDASTDKDEQNVESDDLTSPFTSGGQTPLSEEDSDRGPSIQMQLALSALPKVDTKMPVLADDNNGDDIILEGNEDDEEVEEFQVDEEARMTPRTYAKSGTAELCRMLKIASMSGSTEGVQDDVILPHSVIIEPTKGTKQYGRPLSLDQLFAGAVNNQPSPGTSPVPLTPTNPDNAPSLQQGVPQEVPQGVPQPTAFHPHPQQPMLIPGHHHPGDVKAPMSPGRVGPPNISNSTANSPQPVHHLRQLPNPNNLVSMSTGPPLATGPEGFQTGTQMTVVRAQTFPAQQMGFTSIPQGAVSTSRLSPAHYLPQSAQPSSVAAQPVPAGVVVMGPGVQRGMQQPGFAMHPGGQMPVDQQQGPPWQRVIVSHHQGKQQPFGPQIQAQPLRIPGQHALQVTPHQQPVRQSQISQDTGVKPIMTLSQNMPHPMQFQAPPSSQQPVNPAQVNMNSAQQNVGPGPQNVGLGPQNFGPVQQTIGLTQPNMNTALQNMGPAHQNTGGSNIVRMQGQPLKQMSQLNRQPHMGMAAGMTSQPHRQLLHHPQRFGPSGQLLRPEKPPFVQGFKGQPQNAVQALLTWCQHQNLEYPMYSFQQNRNTGQWRGIVELSNGAQFIGPDCINKDVAAEAVAQATMAQVTKQQPRGFIQQLRPTTRPPVGMNQPQGAMFHTSGANPFVPLQVTKQLNTPSKSHPISETETSPSRIVPNPQVEYPTTVGPSYPAVPQMDSTSMATNQLVFVEKPTLRPRGISGEPPITGMEQTQISGVDVSQGTDHPQKQASSTAAVKSRRGSSKAKLAINFGGQN